MVRVYGPMFSMDASGTVADTLVFSKWKGRNYVRERVIPANPRSPGQVGTRAMFRFLSQIWASMTTARQNEWTDRATARVISNFNAFMGYNQTRWRNFLAPSQFDPAVGATSTANFIGETATAGVRQITLEGTIDGAGGHWGCMIFRALATPVTSSFSNLIAVIATPMHQIYRYVDTPLVADTYYYNFRLFSVEGYLGAQETEVNATVT